MTTAELHDSLNEEQKLALLALRDEMLTAQSAHDAELGAAHLAEKDALEKRISELVAKAETDAIAAKKDADAKLDAYAKRIDELTAQLSERKKTSDEAIAFANDALKSALTERDAQVARAQALAKRFTVAREKRKAADAAYSAVDAEEDATIAEASQSIVAQAQAKIDAEIAAAERRIAELKGRA